MILNRALASSDPVVDAPELEPFAPETQGQVWVALMVWVTLECGAIADVVRCEMRLETRFGSTFAESWLTFQ